MGVADRERGDLTTAQSAARQSGVRSLPYLGRTMLHERPGVPSD